MQSRISQLIHRPGVGAVVEQLLSCRRAGRILTGQQQRSPSVLIERVDGRRMLQKETSHIWAAVLGSPVQRSSFLLVQSPDAGFTPQKEFQEVNLSSTGRQMKCRLPSGIRLVHRTSPVEQQTNWSIRNPLLQPVHMLQNRNIPRSRLSRSTQRQRAGRLWLPKRKRASQSTPSANNSLALITSSFWMATKSCDCRFHQDTPIFFLLLTNKLLNTVAEEEEVIVPAQRVGDPFLSDGD